MRLRLILAATATLIAGQSAAQQPRAATPPGLTAFASDTELRAFLKALAAVEHQRRETMPPPLPPPPMMSAPAPAAESIVVTGTMATDSITNTQVAGVDEGGIVKMSGEIMVVLRRGRLFTVSLAGGRMRPLAHANAYPPGVDGSGDWYDEMLLSGDRVIVVGYSYARGGTEVNRFRLGRDGSLRFEDSTQLKSNDYYSSRNYASRLIGTQLVYYTPLQLNIFANDPLASLPAIRRWQPGAGRGGTWRRVVTAQRVFVPPHFRTARGINLDTVHSVTSCDLAAPRIDCGATAVLGSGSRNFFVSRNAVYVWTSSVFPNSRVSASRGLLYRLPLDQRARPQAVGVRGAPIDQFSFGPDEARGTLNVLVQGGGGGDAMFRPERPGGIALALVRIPMASFGSGARHLPRARAGRSRTVTSAITCSTAPTARAASPWSG